jgi:hypothetical protein
MIQEDSSTENLKQTSYHPSLKKVYKCLKEHLITNWESRTPFIERTQIFSLPIFYQVLLLFNILKAILSSSFFIFSGLEIANLSITFILLEVSIAFLLSRKPERSQDFLKYSYIFLFCWEENYTVYYYNCHTCSLNPGFIFFTLLLILFYDMKTTKAFHEFMFYLYIVNLVLLIYFLSLNNIMNFFVPFNLVLCMFVLLNVISQNYQKKAMKSKVYHDFFEKLVLAMLSKGKMYVLFDDKILNSPNNVHKREETGQLEDKLKKISADNYHESTENSDDKTDDILSLNSDFETEQIEDFKGFKLAYSRVNHSFNGDFLYFNHNIMSNFINLLFFLKNPKNSRKTQSNDQGDDFEQELMAVYTHSKMSLKTAKFVSLVKQSEILNFPLREKILILLIALVFEAAKVSSLHSIRDEKINFPEIILNEENLILRGNDPNSLTLYSFVEELAKSLNFCLQRTQEEMIIKWNRNCELSLDEEEISMMSIMSTISMDSFKVETPRSLGRNKFNFIDN